MAAQALQKEGEKDTDKWIALNKADQEHEERLTKIMANAEALKGKDYIDYLLAFLKGKKDTIDAEEQAKKDRKLKRK